MRRINDFVPRLRAAADALQESGLRDDADYLVGMLTAAYATSSEMLGEIGLAVLKIQRSHTRLPDGVDDAFRYALKEIRKVWPDLR